MPSPAAALTRLASRLQHHGALSSDERELILSLPFRAKTLPANTRLFREDEPVDECSVLLDGFACRYKLMPNGARQILNILVPGEVIGLEPMLLGRADHAVDVLDRAEIALLRTSSLDELLAAHPRIARAFWLMTIRETAIQREWTANIGRRDARSRLAHLLCELAVRLEEAGLGRRGRFDLPLTQTQLADCTGLTPVHINRTLQLLRAEGLIRTDARIVDVPDWERLREAADFEPAYLRAGAAPKAGPAVVA